MEENTKSAQAPQGDASAKDKVAPKTPSAKVTKTKEQKDAEKAAKKAEKDKAAVNSATSAGSEGDAPKTTVVDENVTVQHPKNVVVEPFRPELSVEAETEGILDLVARGTEEIKCSHKAAVKAINTPGAVFDQEEKVLSYKGGKAKLVIA